MADLNSLSASQTVKIAGADSSGNETNFADVDSSNNLKTVNNSISQDEAAVPGYGTVISGKSPTNTSLPALTNEFGNLAIDVKKGLKSNFSRIRVSNTINVFESIFAFDKLDSIWSETTSGGGTSTWVANSANVEMTVPTTSGASVIRQTFHRIRYNPGRTVVVQISADLGGNKANCRRRIGQFDVNNGIFFELDGSTLNAVVRSSTSGSVVDTVIPQSTWNIDKLDGTGASGITLDTEMHQLFIIDYAWQGIGSVRFGIYLNGEIYYVHEHLSANSLALPYMRTANLPLRLEIVNTAATASPTTLYNNCCVIENEGSDRENEGNLRSFNSTTLKTVSAGTSTPVLSVRLDSTRLEGIVQILKAVVYVQTADDVAWELWRNPTLTGSTFANSSGYLEIDLAASSMTGGTLLDSGFARQNNSNDISSYQVLSTLVASLGVSLAGTSDIITIAAKSRATTADVLSAITWREY